MEERSYLKNKEILVTGGYGFLGRHVIRKLVERGADKERIAVPYDQDLREYVQCEEVVKGKEIVIHLAAKARNSKFNLAYPGEMLYDNLSMGMNMLDVSRIYGVSKFVSVGTACSYPSQAKVPLLEEDIWNGYPAEPSAAYGIAKRMLIAQGQACRKQYGFNSIHLILANMYGLGDNFKEESSYVIPSMIRKLAEAKRNGERDVELVGTGKATREFLYVEDAAEGIVMATEEYDGAEPINLGTGKETSVKELVETISGILHFNGMIRWNGAAEDQSRRFMDVKKAKEAFGFSARTDLEDGLRKTIDWYLYGEKGDRI